MKRGLSFALLMIVVAAAIVGGWWFTHQGERDQQLALYGNMDLRQVALAFNNSERIAAVLVQEGDRVHKGQTLARLDTSRLQPLVAQAEAQVAAQRQVVLRLHNGSRPEEIDEARASVASAKADADNARRQSQRLKELSEKSQGGAVSQQDVDNARTALDMAEAKLALNQEGLKLAVAGPRKEDIAEAEARLQANKAQLALLRQQLADADLHAPTEAVIRSRLMEPGEMASPQKPVFSLAVVDPKWVRAYVSEPDLGRVHPGAKATIAVDSFPGRQFEGWVGFISPVAEFTPKSVETVDLRSSLVYEVRVFVKDPTDQLRLGMPATVRLPLEPAGPASAMAPDSPATSGVKDRK